MLERVSRLIMTPRASPRLEIIRFSLAVGVLYLVFPAFLPQNHDAQNFYFFVMQKLAWHASPFELFTFSPLHGAGSTFWPSIVEAIPHLWIFSLVDDPTLRIYGTQVAASILLFSACLFLYRSLGFHPTVATLAVWLAFALIMIHTLAYISSPDNLATLFWMIISIGSLNEIGYGGRWRTTVFVVAAVLAVFLFTLAVPSWHVVALPAFLCFAFFSCLGAPSFLAGFIRALSVMAPISVQILHGEYDSLYYAMADSARVMLANLFHDVPRYRTLAGHLFVTTEIDLLVGAMFLLGVTSFTIAHDPSRARTAVSAQIGTLTFYCIMIIVGLAFLFLDTRWRLPNPKYMVQFALPWVCLYAVIGARRYIAAAREMLQRDAKPVTEVPRGRAENWQQAGWWVAGIYLALHAIAPSSSRTTVLVAIGLLAMVGTLARLRLNKIAMIAGGVVVIILLLRHVEVSFGNGADWRRDGARRMGLVQTPVVRFLADRVAIFPGRAFGGYVEDLYRRPIESKDLTDFVVAQWGTNWQKYGSGHKLFAWNVFGIPTLSEYHQYTKPLFYSLFMQLLTERDDIPGISYTVVTRPDEKILAMLGVRYIVRDSPEPPSANARRVFAWDKFHVFELQRPNLGNYSPNHVILATTATEALSQMASPLFDPRRDVILPAPLAPEKVLVPGTGQLEFIRGGWRAKVWSKGYSLAVLPVAYTHCFEMKIEQGDPHARLLRVNLAMTGLLYRGPVTVTARLKRWPLAGPDCQRADYNDSVTFRVGDLAPVRAGRDRT